MNGAVQFQCECGQKFRSPANKAGHIFPCPKCGNTNMIPAQITEKQSVPIVLPDNFTLPTVIDPDDPVPIVDRRSSAIPQPTSKATAETLLTKKQKEELAKTGVGLICAVLLCWWIGVFERSPVRGHAATNSPSPEELRPVHTGEMGVLHSPTGEVPFGTTQEAFDRMLELAIAGDDTGTRRLVVAGLVGFVDNGTMCKVIKPGIFNYEVRIANGKHSGTLAFIASEHVHRKD